jgi:hypothetical protein
MIYYMGVGCRGANSTTRPTRHTSRHVRPYRRHLIGDVCPRYRMVRLRGLCLRVVFSSQLKVKTGHILTKDVDLLYLRINLNIDVTPIAFRSHTHTSHSQTSRLSTSSLSVGVPVPRTTHCI